MSQLLASLRKSPDGLKKQIAFFSALTVSGIIALVWLSTLPGQLAPETSKTVAVTEEHARESEEPGPLTLFLAQLGALWDIFPQTTPSDSADKPPAPSQAADMSDMSADPETWALPDSIPADDEKERAKRIILIGTTTAAKEQESE